MEEHDGKEVKFSMKIVRGHRTPLTRQIHESVEIENSKAVILMNSKSEYHGSRIPRIVIEVGDRVETEDWQGKGGRRKGSSKKESGWKINNMKKRKRTGEDECNISGEDKDEIPECDPAQSDDVRMSVESRSGGQERNRKRRRIVQKYREGHKVEKKPVCDQAHPKTEQSVETPREINLSECGQTQLEGEDERPGMCQALDRVEMCYNIVVELVDGTQAQLSGKLCHIQATQNKGIGEENVDVFGSKKRRISESSRKRKSSEEGRILRQTKFQKVTQEVITSSKKETGNSNQISNSCNKENLPNLEIENRPIKKPLKGKAKPKCTRTTKIKPTVQKTKITKFFQIMPTENSGLKTGACVEKNNLLSTQSAIIFGGGGGRKLFCGG